MLFETLQEQRPDGSFLVKPRRLVDGREISAAAACRLLGYKDKETVCRMVATGEIKGWKPRTRRGNGKWRIDMGSVLDYKAERLKSAREMRD